MPGADVRLRQLGGCGGGKDRGDKEGKKEEEEEEEEECGLERGKPTMDGHVDRQLFSVTGSALLKHGRRPN
ncbi:hypothetical protein Pmani_035771 [Petrolisthes manimaculis]|uniref:Uncharacterized protein n=1 Tax=Petrolisthes manimaculis TaxID=1843537 RepID=A0AAE1TNC8_9EUCA|nr:hypothetical protein Pmani_035771 [Petrolisthes manimaculis]